MQRWGRGAGGGGLIDWNLVSRRDEAQIIVLLLGIASHRLFHYRLDRIVAA